MKNFDAQLLTPEYIASPYHLFDQLRTDAPIYWSEKWGAWLATRYEDVTAILKDYRTFSNNGRYTAYMNQFTPEQRSQLGYLLEHYEDGGLVQADPPDHTRLRSLVNQGFTPRVIGQMAGLVTGIVNELLDGIESRGQVELISEFAFPLPAIVIAGMLGVPAEDREQFKVWSSRIQRFLGSGQINFQYALEAQESWQNMNAIFKAILDDRRQQPQNDIVSALALARDENDMLTETELVRTCGAILIAGHETTTNLISSGILALLKHPEQLAMLKDNPTLYSTAVEEFLRYDTPFQFVPRIIREDCEWRGKQLKRGQLIYLMLGAANRDPEIFAAPDQLDITRPNNKQIAFGYGVHFCLGAALARLEAPIALRLILERFPDLRLNPNDPPQWKVSMGQRGLAHFPLLF